MIVIYHCELCGHFIMYTVITADLGRTLHDILHGLICPDCFHMQDGATI
jgi:hypothetical protein